MAQPNATNMQLNGRVFTRLQQYKNLPTELKLEVEELEKYLTKIQAQIFDTHHTIKLKKVYGVRKQELLEKIDAWVKQHGQGHVAGHGGGHKHGHGHGVGRDHSTDPMSKTERMKEHLPTTSHGHTHTHSTDPYGSKTERIKDDVMHPTSHGHTQTHGTDPYASNTERIKDDVMHPTSHGHTHTHGTDPYASKTERIKDDVMHPTSHGHTQTHGTDPYASKTERIKDDIMHPTSHGHTQTHSTDPYASKTERIKDDVMHPTSHGHTQTHGTDPYASKTERIKDDVMHPTSHGHSHTHGTDPYASKTERIKDDLKHPTSHGHTHTHATDATTKPHHGTTSATTPATNTNVGNYQIAGSATPATASVPAVTPGKGGATGHNPRSEKLLDALVLKGFVTPHKEDKPKNATPATDLDFKNNELFVARGKGIASPEAIDAGPSVWDLVDGAVFAGMIKRKAGLLEPLIHGKDTYAVVNSRLKTLALFKTDLSRKPIAQFSGRSLHVSFDKTHYEHGVKVWNETESSLLNTATQSESDALVEALIAIGASHRDGLDRAHAPAVTTGEKVREEAKKAVGVDDANTRHQSHGMYKSPAGDHITPVSPDGSNRIPDQQHTRHPTHTSEAQGQHQHHGMEKQGLGGENRNAVLGNQPGDKTQYQAQGLPTANDNLKREHGEPRGFAQVSDPTMTP